MAQIGKLLKLNYAAAESAAAVTVPPSAVPPGAALLPREVCAELRQAIASGDIAGLRKLVAQTVQPLNPVLGRTLSQLADGYDYPAIMQVLKEIERPD